MLGKTCRALAWALAVVLLLAGCGAVQTGGETTAAPAAAATGAPTASAEATAVASANTSSTLHTVLPNGISCDPFRATTQEQAAFHRLLFNSLFTLDASGKLQSDLVSTYELDEERGLCILTLRQDAVFHETGGTLTAQDVLYSYQLLQYYTDAESRYVKTTQGIEYMYIEAGGQAVQPSFSIDERGDEGDGDSGETDENDESDASDERENDDVQERGGMRARTRGTRNVGLQTWQPDATPLPDTGATAQPEQKQPEQKLVVKFTTAGYKALYALVFPVVSADYYGEHDLRDATPCGSGRYQVTDWNDAHWTLRATSNAYAIQTIQASKVQDGQAVVTALTNANLDVAISTSPAVRQKLSATAGIQSTDLAANTLTLLIPNCNGTMGDVQLRRAAACALDRKDMLGRVLTGHGVVVDTPVPTYSYLYSVEYNNNLYNLKRSQQILEENGWTLDEASDLRQLNGTPLSLSLIQLASDSTAGATAKLVASHLEEAGFYVEITALDAAAYQSALTNGEFDLALYTGEMAESLEIASRIGSDGAQNYGRYYDGDMDALLYACAHAQDADAYAQAERAVQQKFLEDLPLLCLWFSNITCLSNSALAEDIVWRPISLFYDGVENWSL